MAEPARFSLVAVPRPDLSTIDAWTSHGVNAAGQEFAQAGVTLSTQLVRVEVSGGDVFLAIDELERRLKDGLGQVIELRAAARRAIRSTS